MSSNPGIRSSASYLDLMGSSIVMQSQLVMTSSDSITTSGPVMMEKILKIVRKFGHDHLQD